MKANEYLPAERQGVVVKAIPFTIDIMCRSRMQIKLSDEHLSFPEQLRKK